MGRRSTIPNLIDDCKTINISKLKEWHYLAPNTHQSGNITWSRQGQQTGKIGISVVINEDTGILTLGYTCDKEPVKYDVEIISKHSNLGKGLIWYFICPKTGKQCRKLYLGEKYFLHRTAFTGYLYETQTWSKNTQGLAKTVYKDLLNEKYYDEIYSKHFKKRYNGKLTKRYLGLLKKIG